jgi:hypothetical protein
MGCHTSVFCLTLLLLSVYCEMYAHTHMRFLVGHLDAASLRIREHTRKSRPHTDKLGICDMYTHSHASLEEFVM